MACPSRSATPTRHGTVPTFHLTKKPGLYHEDTRGDGRVRRCKSGQRALLRGDRDDRLDSLARVASAAPIKVACIGEHTTHSHAFRQPTVRTPSASRVSPQCNAARNRLRVRNFGDCCSTCSRDKGCRDAPVQSTARMPATASATREASFSSRCRSSGVGPARLGPRQSAGQVFTSKVSKARGPVSATRTRTSKIIASLPVPI